MKVEIKSFSNWILFSLTKNIIIIRALNRDYIILFIIRIKLYYYFSREKKQKITWNNITPIDFTFCIMKIFEFRFKKKKGKKKSRKDNFPSFFTASWTHTYTPRHPVHDETAHTSLDPTMSAIRRRGNGGAIEGERARYTTKRIECRRSARERERESATTSADRFLRSRG